jgi:hypothetical protein
MPALTAVEVVGTFRRCICSSCIAIHPEGIVWGATAAGESEARAAFGDRPAREPVLHTVWAASSDVIGLRAFAIDVWEGCAQATPTEDKPPSVHVDQVHPVPSAIVKSPLTLW